MNIRTTAVTAMLALCLFSCNEKSAIGVSIDEGIDTIPDPINTIADCSTDGGKADDTGLTVWCWSDIILPEYFDDNGVEFSGGELYVDSECYEKQVTNTGDHVKFNLNPTDGPQCRKLVPKEIHYSC